MKRNANQKLIDRETARKLGAECWRRFRGQVGTCPFPRGSKLADAWWAGFHADRARPSDDDPEVRTRRLFRIAAQTEN